MKIKLLLGLAATCLITGNIAFAAPVTPAGTFGTLSDYTYGTGNPNDAFMTTTITDRGNTITLGLQAQGRYNNPAVGNNGAGIYYATPGENYGTPATPTTPGTPSPFKGATWNFDFYFDATGGSYTYKLFFGTDASSLVSFDPTILGDNGSSTHTGGQNSENLDFTGFKSAIGFDPNADGIYSFELVAYDLNNDAIGHSAINVDVRSVPDAASTAGLLGLAFAGLAAFGFRKNRLAMAK